MKLHKQPGRKEGIKNLEWLRIGAYAYNPQIQITPIDTIDTLREKLEAAGFTGPKSFTKQHTKGVGYGDNVLKF